MFFPRSFRFGACLTLALAAPLVASSSATAQATKVQVPARDKMKKAEAPAPAPRSQIDLNSATSEELQTLPGVGEATARKIIDGRPHKTVADLTNSGVPGATIDKIKPLVEVKPLPSPVDVNHDPADRLQTLPGVGPVLAKEIIAGRPYANYEAFGNVKGIGPEKLDALRGRLKFGEHAATAKAKAAEKASTPKPTPGAKVNINSATKEELDALFGIGGVRAQAIIDARPYSTIEDIKKVKGIKDVEFAKIKDQITVK